MRDLSSLLPAACAVTLLIPAQQAHAVKVKVATATASSSYPPEQGVVYDPNRAMDGKQSTAWVEGDDGSGLGSWLELDLGGTKTINRIRIWGGLWYSAEYWERANRPKDLEVKFSDGSTQKITLTNEMKVQDFPLSAKSTSSVRLRVESVHSGSTWHDTAISEVQVYDTSPDGVASVREMTSSSESPADADGNYGAANVGDGVVDSMWCEGDAEGDGTGDWIDFAFTGSQQVSSLHLVNGIGTSLSFWMKGNRATGATLTFSDGSAERVTIKNVMLPQKVEFSPRTTSSVRVTFDEVTRGKEFNDLCISEAYFEG